MQCRPQNPLDVWIRVEIYTKPLRRAFLVCLFVRWAIEHTHVDNGITLLNPLPILIRRFTDLVSQRDPGRATGNGIRTLGWHIERR